MPLKEAHFERWLFLFNETIDEHFSGEISNQAKQRAQLIGWTIKSKMQK
jgi:hemoglobin